MDSSFFGSGWHLFVPGAVVGEMIFLLLYVIVPFCCVILWLGVVRVVAPMLLSGVGSHLAADWPTDTVHFFLLL